MVRCSSVVVALRCVGLLLLGCCGLVLLCWCGVDGLLIWCVVLFVRGFRCGLLYRCCVMLLLLRCAIALWCWRVCCHCVVVLLCWCVRRWCCVVDVLLGRFAILLCVLIACVLSWWGFVV